MKHFDGKAASRVTGVDIEALVANRVREDQWLEFKQEPWRSPHECLKDISALANAEGGYIILGIQTDVEERAVAVVGVAKAADQAQRARRWALDTIEPPISGLDAAAVEMEPSKHVVVVSVPRSADRPHKAPRKQDLPFARRHGSDTRMMTLPELRGVFLEPINVSSALEFGQEMTQEFSNFHTRLDGPPWLRLTATPLDLNAITVEPDTQAGSPARVAFDAILSPLSTVLTPSDLAPQLEARGLVLSADALLEARVCDNGHIEIARLVEGSLRLPIKDYIVFEPRALHDQVREFCQAACNLYRDLNLHARVRWALEMWAADKTWLFGGPRLEGEPRVGPPALSSAGEIAISFDQPTGGWTARRAARSPRPPVAYLCFPWDAHAEEGWEAPARQLLTRLYRAYGFSADQVPYFNEAGPA